MEIRGFASQLLGWWSGTPLFARIAAALVLGAATGLALGPRAAALGIIGQLFMRLLSALAPPLILVAVIQVLMRAELPPGVGWRLIRLLTTNTLVAIFIGLLVANILQPGRWREVPPLPPEEAAVGKDPLALFLDNVPRSFLGPLGDDGKVMGVIFLAVALGIALRKHRTQPLRTVEDAVQIARDALIQVLHWLIELIPLAVFAICAKVIGTEGFERFASLAGFVVAVLCGLAIMAGYYLLRVRLGSWVRPGRLLAGTKDALLMAFSTASSTATMPVTYACLKEKVGLREEPASLGALVGTNFNNDGTALYEAMSALFVAQMIGLDLGLREQFIVVLTSVVASVGAAGIPNAGLATMTLVFTAVGLPKEYIPLLVAVDWFLDRCRTAINVMGDCTVSCLLEGQSREEAPVSATLSTEGP